MYDIKKLNIWKQEPEKSSRDTEFMEAEITELNLSTRSFNCLKRAGIHTIGELIQLIENDENGLRNIRNLGSRSEAEIRKAIGEYREMAAAQAEPGTFDYLPFIRRAKMRSAKEIWNADIEEFHLSRYAYFELTQRGICKVRDLYATNPRSEPGWYAVRELFEKISSVMAM